MLYQNFLPFLWLNNTPLYVHTTFCLSVYFDEHLDCFCLLAVVSNAAMNMSVQMTI